MKDSPFKFDFFFNFKSIYENNSTSYLFYGSQKVDIKQYVYRSLNDVSFCCNF